jgi:hypothetical protein
MKEKQERVRKCVGERERDREKQEGKGKREKKIERGRGKQQTIEKSEEK